MNRNSNRGTDQIPAGVCIVCDGQTVLWTHGFGNEPNKSVTCPECGGTGRS